MTATPHTSPVTLNSFQGPSRPTRRSAVGRRSRAVALSTQATGRAARWMLKQVQHDDDVQGCGGMKTLAPYLLAFALLAPTPSVAQGASEQADQAQAAQVFWSFSRCAVKHDSARALRVLAAQHWVEESNSAPVIFAQRHGGCLNSGDVLSAEGNLFRGAMAGAFFVERHRDDTLPDYSRVPRYFDQASLDREADPEHKRRLSLLAFTECVFRSSPEKVLALLKTKPADEAEAKGFQGLNDTLGPCLSASEGTQIRFTKISLRGLLGEAAYAVDQAYQPSLAQASREGR